MVQSPGSPHEGMPDLPPDVADAVPAEVREIYEAVQAEIEILRRNALPPGDPESNWELPGPNANQAMETDPVSLGSVEEGEADNAESGDFTSVDGPSGSGSRPALCVDIPEPIPSGSSESSSAPSAPSEFSIQTYLTVRSPTQDEHDQAQAWVDSPNPAPGFLEHLRHLTRAPTRAEMQYIIDHPVHPHIGYEQGLEYMVNFVNGMERLRVFRRAREERLRWEQLNPDIDSTSDEDSDTPQYPDLPAPESPYTLRDRLLEEAVNSNISADGDPEAGLYQLERERRRRRWWQWHRRHVPEIDGEVPPEWDVPELTPDSSGSDHRRERERQLSEELEEIHEGISDEELIRYFHRDAEMDLTGQRLRIGEDTGEDIDME